MTGYEHDRSSSGIEGLDECGHQRSVAGQMGCDTEALRLAAKIFLRYPHDPPFVAGFGGFEKIWAVTADMNLGGQSMPFQGHS